MPDDTGAGAYHQIHAFLPVFVMASSHGVLKVRLIVILSPEHTDASLSQHGITGIHILLAYHQDMQVLRQVQGSV